MQTGSFTNSTGSSLDAEAGGKITVTGNLTNSGTLTTNIANLGGAANTLTVTGTLTNNTGATSDHRRQWRHHRHSQCGSALQRRHGHRGHGRYPETDHTGADTNSGSITVTGGTLSMRPASFTNCRHPGPGAKGQQAHRHRQPDQQRRR